jgi:hypothetical protein
MSKDQNLIDSIMGFEPQKLEIFQENKSTQDPNVYKTNPKDSTADDGVYRSKVKVILNPFKPSASIVPQTTYFLKALDGSMLVRSSLSQGDKNCPLFKCWKRIWYQGDDKTPDGIKKREEARARAKSIFDKSETKWVLVQILEDDNKPELVGQFRVMKLAKDIYDKIDALMNPSAASKKNPYPVMDYVVGLALDIVVTPGPDDPTAPERKQREISYTLSQFGDYASIIKTDGTNLLTDEEMETVDNYVSAAKDAQDGKTEKKRADGAKKVAALRPELRPIYEKVIMYVKDNLKDVVTGQPLDLEQYCGFQPWDENTTTAINHFIEIVDGGYSPENMGYDQFKALQAPAVPTESSDAGAQVAAASAAPATPEAGTTQVLGDKGPEDDDLPF